MSYMSYMSYFMERKHAARWAPALINQRSRKSAKMGK
jgi:hypothetical protein